MYFHEKMPTKGYFSTLEICGEENNSMYANNVAAIFS